MDSKRLAGRGLGLVLAAMVATGCGSDGDDGKAGESGAMGDAGLPGMDGMNGMNGSDGDKGDKGDRGDKGLNALIEHTPVRPGSDCPFGGLRFDSGTDQDGDGMLDAAEIEATSYSCHHSAPFTLQLLHFADMDSNEATALNAVDEFSALVDGFRKDPIYGPATLVVSSGDNMIPGPRWFAAENTAVRALTGSNEPGHVDHYFMNHFGVAASALGNHDLDQGPGEFAGTLASESFSGVTYPGTRFPYLAANVDFSGEAEISVGEAGQDARLLGGQVAPSATVRIGGELIGLVGASTPQLPTITSTGALTIAGSTTDLAALAAAIQPTIDALTARGIDKIVLLTHMQQIAIEKGLAGQLSDVDVIVAGGSNTRMGDDDDTLFPGDSAFAEAYPFATTDADGNPLLIVNVDADYKYLGRLVVSFDEEGVVIPGSVDSGVSGAWASTPENVLRSGGSAMPEVVAVRDAVLGVIATQFENVVGYTDVFLEGRRGYVRTEETNLGNLTADSMKWYAESCTQLQTESVLALKNGGGIRAEIGDAVVTGTTTTLNPPSNVGLSVGAGAVSEGHLRGTLRFDNGVVVVDVTGSELKMLLEHGVAGVGSGATPGAFPQVAGIAFSFDPSGTAQTLTTDGSGVPTAVATAGSRVRDLYVDTDNDFVADTALYVGGVAQAAASNTFPLATLNFLANGGDGYPYALLSVPNRRQAYTAVGFGDPDAGSDGVPDFAVMTNCDPGMQSGFSYSGGEQDALAEYLMSFYPTAGSAFSTAETAPAADVRIQDLDVVGTFTVPTT